MCFYLCNSAEKKFHVNSERYNNFKPDISQKVRYTAKNQAKLTIYCVKSFGILEVPFHVYTKFTPFEEKLDVVFKFLARQKRGAVVIISFHYSPLIIHIDGTSY